MPPMRTIGCGKRALLTSLGEGAYVRKKNIAFPGKWRYLASISAGEYLPRTLER